MTTTAQTKVSKVTKSTILKCYEYKEKFGDKVSNIEISKLVGISDSTVGRIFKGDYDYLLEEKKKEEPKQGAGDIANSLSAISEQIFKMNNGIQFDHTELGDLVEDAVKELRSIGDLLHIIAVYHMRNEKNSAYKAKMADQIQHCHSTKRISEATKK